LNNERYLFAANDYPNIREDVESLNATSPLVFGDREFSLHGN
jgi:hypothetical protein